MSLFGCPYRDTKNFAGSVSPRYILRFFLLRVVAHHRSDNLYRSSTAAIEFIISRYYRDTPVCRGLFATAVKLLLPSQASSSLLPTLRAPSPLVVSLCGVAGALPCEYNASCGSRAASCLIIIIGYRCVTGRDFQILIRY